MKISNSSSQDLYARVVMHLATYTINTVTPQLVNLRLSTVDALNKDAGFWSPATRVRRSTDVARWSAPDHVERERTSVEDAVKEKSDYILWNRFWNLEGKSEIWAPKDCKEWTTFGLNLCWYGNVRLKNTGNRLEYYFCKISDPKTPATEYS